MAIVQSMAGQILDDVYVIETQSPPNIQGVATGIVKMVGTFNKGIPGAVYIIDDYASAVRLLGKSTLTVEGPLNLQALINQKTGGIRVVPVFGQGASAAKVTLKDSQQTTGNVLTLTAAQAHPQTGIVMPVIGVDPNSMIVTISNTTGSTFDVSIQSGGITENYKGLTIGTMVTAINNESKIALASVPDTASSQLPKAGTFQFSGGSNGGAVTDADFIGTVDSKGIKTGLMALEAFVGNLAFVANQSSAAINTAVSVHANKRNCIGAVCGPIDGTVSTISSARSSISQDNIVFCDGWRTMLDADTGTIRNVAPTALVIGMASQNAVHKSWGNKSIYGTLAAVSPRSDSELAILQQANVLCVCDNIPRGGVGTRSGVASDGSDVYVRAMRYFLEISLMSAMGWAVDEMQSSEPNDPLRKDIKDSIDAFLSPMAKPLDPKNKTIDSFLVICDLSNNPPQQVAAGKLSVNVKVRLLGSAKQITIFADISQGTVTTSSQSA